MNTRDPRIGLASDGTAYAFIDGYRMPEYRGTVAQVEHALALADKRRDRPVTAKAIREELTAARRTARQEANRNGWRCVYGRGLIITGMRDGNRSPSFDEGWEVYGSYPSAREIQEAIEVARAEGCDDLVIVGGFDGAESVHDYTMGLYDPWVSEFEVSIPI